MKSAAEAHLLAAQLSLGMLHEAGPGWQRDVLRAAIWYRRAARNGSAPAQINLAYLYAVGSGVEQDLVEVSASYLAAKDGSHPMAQENLDNLSLRMTEAKVSAAEQRACDYGAELDPALAAKRAAA